MEKVSRFLNALMIYVLVGIILSAYYQQYTKSEVPCPLCILQRLGMIGAASGAFLNLRFGIRPFHYGITLLAALGGVTVSIRQVLLHICPGGRPFGIPVLGLSMYTWAMIAFTCVILSTAILLMLYHPRYNIAKMNWFEKIAAAGLIAITLANTLTTFFECGFGACVG